MLQEICKQDKYWRRLALKICGNKILADDIVQEMYLRIHKAKPKEVNKSYIYYCLNSIYIDLIKKEKKTSSLDNIILSVNERKEVDDYEKKILDNFDKLPWHQKELIQESYTKSNREIQKEFGINYMVAYKATKQGIKTILGNDYDTKHNDTRRKRP